jgi:Mg2+/Co2+ transporter CorB
VGMAFHRIHFLANETPSSKSLNHFTALKRRIKEIFDHFGTQFSINFSMNVFA